MQIQVLKSKIHNAIVTEANINYVGSITIDPNLLEATRIMEGEQVHVINHRNGERLITYAIPGVKGSGMICMNGPAALKVSKGDKIIIIAYAQMSPKRASTYRPFIIFPMENNTTW